MISASLRYKVHPYAITTYEVADLAGGSTRAESYFKADNPTMIIGIPIFDCGRLLGLMSASRRYKIRPYIIETQNFAGYCGGDSWGGRGQAAQSPGY